MTWLHKYEMLAAGILWLNIVCGERDTHTQTNTLKAFRPLAQDKVISSSSLLFWWMLRVQVMSYKVVCCSFAASISHRRARGCINLLKTMTGHLSIWQPPTMTSPLLLPDVMEHNLQANRWPRVDPAINFTWMRSPVHSVLGRLYITRSHRSDIFVLPCGANRCKKKKHLDAASDPTWEHIWF